MKILHLMFDGYSPLNDTRKAPKGAVDLNMFEGMERLDYVQYISTDRPEIRSIRQWFKFYSKVAVVKNPDGSDGRKPRSSLYESQATTDDLLWNKLTDLGVVNLWRPVSYMTARDFYWMFGKDWKTKSNLGMSLKDYRSTRSRHFIGGKWESYLTDTIMSALMPAVVKDVHPDTWLTMDTDTYEVAQKFSSTPYPDEAKETYEHMINNTEYLPRLHERISTLLDGNAEEYLERILPNFSKILKDNEGNEDIYVHLGLEESACMYYMYAYDDIKYGPWSDYVKVVVDKIRSMIDFDIILITGDHGICNADDLRSPYRYIFDKDPNKKIRKNNKPGFYSSAGFSEELGISRSFGGYGVFGIFGEHAYEVGATILHKNDGSVDAMKEFIESEVGYHAFDDEEVLLANELDHEDDRSLLEIMHDAILLAYDR